jgi:putative ABC transport system permease protein
MSPVKSFVRYGLKFKTYYAIAIGGLALGLGSSVALFNFVSAEFNYDKFHNHAENVFRLNTMTQTPSGSQVQAAATPLLAPTLMTEMPEVEAAVRLRHADDVIVRIGEKQFHETKVFYADSNFFKVLTFPLAKGDPETALSQINTAVITSEFAQKYFGAEDPINKTIEVDNILLEVKGVTLPTKSHFDFDILISFETFTPPKGSYVTLTSWAWTSFPTYVRLRPGSDPKHVEAKFPEFIRKYRSAEDAGKINYQLQPITDVYLHSRDVYERDGISAKGDHAYTVGLAAVAAIILIIACFNFANISTALSIYRVKETGIKRSLGSSRTEIFIQAMMESMLTATLSLIVGLMVMQAASASFEKWLGVTFEIELISLQWLPVYAGLVIIAGFVGGLYPAIFLSRLKPQLAMRGTLPATNGQGKLAYKRTIVVFQFLITAVLIAASLSIKKQMDYIQSKDLGYTKDGFIVLHLPDRDMRKLYSSLRNRFAANANVLGVSASRDLFDGQQATTDVEEFGSADAPLPISVFRMYPNFAQTMGIEVVAGRAFAEPLTDSTAFMLNEAAVKMLGWTTKDAVGKKLRSYGQTGEVIGVVKGFHFSSLHSAIGPLIMLIPKTKVEYLYLRVVPGNLSTMLPSIQADWNAIASHLPFEYILLDEHVGQLYRQDKRLSQLLFVFCGLSVALACLGLFGIISLMAESRAKEIGIRKVLGASVMRITTMLSGELLLLAFIAALIAVPLSYYCLERWLSGFAYRIDVPVDFLILSVCLSTLLAGFAVCFKAVRAAIANPVDVIKSE